MHSSIQTLDRVDLSHVKPRAGAKCVSQQSEADRQPWQRRVGRKEDTLFPPCHTLCNIKTGILPAPSTADLHSPQSVHPLGHSSSSSVVSRSLIQHIMVTMSSRFTEILDSSDQPLHEANVSLEHMLEEPRDRSTSTSSDERSTSPTNTSSMQQALASAKTDKSRLRGFSLRKRSESKT